MKEEGSIREIIRQIQELRKAAKFVPTDKITIYAAAEGEMRTAIEKNTDLLVRETKAVRLEFGKPNKTAAHIEAMIDKQPLWLGIKKC